MSLLSKRECSVQGAVYNILPELILGRVFPAVHLLIQMYQTKE